MLHASHNRFSLDFFKGSRVLGTLLKVIEHRSDSLSSVFLNE